ncbi:MAG TPA: NrdH-redoxin [Peptococcaceae bacterium]|nr:NrdH-redoxin [Peptococcaceae bacterium]
MKEFLSRKGVDFEEKDISRDEKAQEEMYRRTGFMAVPTTVIGQEVVVGYDPQRLEKMLH